MAGLIPRHPTQPPGPTPVRQFAALARLLDQRLGLSVGAATEPDSAAHGLLHFQRFGMPDAAWRSSFEQHADGTIYLAFTPTTAPTWYDVSQAEDREGHRNRRFAHLLRMNVDRGAWPTVSHAFPPGRKPAPRWMTFSLPLLDPCAMERAHLAALETVRQGPAPSTAQRVVRALESPIWNLEIHRLMRRLGVPECRPRPAADWNALLRGSTHAGLDRMVPRATAPLAHAGDYCYRDAASVFDPLKSGPPSWQTILPENTSQGGEWVENGQRKLYPERHLGLLGNHYVSWPEVTALMQSDPARARAVLPWSGHPTREDIKDRTIPWLSSSLEGIVTNSFLSGSDYAGNHYDAPEGYWLGTADSTVWDACGLLNAQHALCNDWIVYLEPDPESRFLLAVDAEREEGMDHGLGNTSAELRGNLETEIEQWLMPRGFRPQPGDRIQMAGRWVIDCGHDDWHAELHPIGAFVTEHVEGERAVASVVVTGDWPGGQLDLDVWPPARPSPSATLVWQRENAPQVVQDLTLGEWSEPPDNPNHLRLRIASGEPRRPLPTGDWNQVEPHPTRRLAAKYRLWWR